jgi:hypothetical protein
MQSVPVEVPRRRMPRLGGRQLSRAIQLGERAGGSGHVLSVRLV